MGGEEGIDSKGSRSGRRSRVREWRHMLCVRCLQLFENLLVH